LCLANRVGLILFPLQLRGDGVYFVYEHLKEPFDVEVSDSAGLSLCVDQLHDLLPFTYEELLQLIYTVAS
jgi:hypothetical protein